MADELQVDLIVQAIDRASAVMNQVAANTSGLTTKTQEHTQAVQKGESIFTTFNQAMGAANQIMQVSKQVWDSSVGSVISYDESIRQVSAATGISSEETSKLLDLTDNFGISTGELMMAQKKLASEGYSLNINTLKELATQYNEMGSQAEKTTFLTDKFGRSGLQFAEMFNFGTEAMDKFYNGSAAGMVRTEEQTRSTLLLTIAQKDLGDAWQGLTNKVVTPAIPGITSYIKTATEELTAFTSGNAADAIGFIGHQYQLAFGLIQDTSKGLEDQVSGVKEKSAPKYGPFATPEQLDSMNADKYNQIIGLTQEVNAQSEALATAQGTLQEKIAGVREELDRSAKLGYSPAGQHMKELKGDLEGLLGQYQANETAAQESTNQQVYADYMKMQSGKQMTTALFEQQQQLGLAFGVFTEADVKTATKMRELEQSFETGKISAKQYYDSVQHINDVPVTTGQSTAQAWMEQNQQQPAEEVPPSLAPATGKTGQQSAQGWLDSQAQAKKTQDAAKAATTAMSTEFTSFSGTIQKQADAATSKVGDLLDMLTSVGKFGSITISVTGGPAAAGAEYP